MNLATELAPPLAGVGLESHGLATRLTSIEVQAVLVESGFIIQSPTVLKAHETVTKLL